MSLRILITAALAAFTFAPAALRAQANDAGKSEQELLEEAEALQGRLQTSIGELLAPIQVNGETVDPLTLKRQAVYIAGSKLLELKIADFFIEEYKKEAIENGRDPKEFEIDEQEVVDALSGVLDEFLKQNPGVPFWDVVRSQLGLTKEMYLLQFKQGKLFDRIFFPGAPKDWPAVTKEAVMGQGGANGAQFLEQLEKMAAVDEEGNARPLPDFWLVLMRQFVNKQLRSWSEIRYGSQGLDSEFVIEVNGETWKTEDAFESVKSGLYLKDFENAVQEIVIREALRQELEKNDSYISDETFEERFNAYREPFDATPFNTEVIAMQFKGYPSMEAFRTRWRLISSFTDLIADRTNKETLAKHAEDHAQFLRGGSVGLDVIPFLAKDARTGVWIADGMSKAEERATAAFQSIESGEKTFEEVLAERGEFFANDEDKGRLGLKPLNQIRQYLRETEFTDLIKGYAISRQAFFNYPIGKVVGPLRGVDSCYLVRVNVKTPPRKALNLDKKEDYDLIKEDFIATEFLKWSNEVLKNTTVK